LTAKPVPIVSALALIAVILVAGCSSNNSAPVSSRSAPPSNRIMVHQVESGETLYSIAWRYDLDFRKLARANGIREPFVISRGQLVSLDTSKISSAAAKTVNKSAKKAKIVAPKASSTVAATSSKVSKTLKSEAKPAANRTVFSTAWTWQWPIKGKIIEPYSLPKLHKGIKMKSVSRAAVRSSAPGVVVYAGEGLRGYGKLVIVKHSDILLSAYAHNDQIMVSEGQTVRQTEIIARLGSDGAMYFEIRKDGYPVDPEAYLK
jgi:lipoprotein NlpD